MFLFVSLSWLRPNVASTWLVCSLPAYVELLLNIISYVYDLKVHIILILLGSDQIHELAPLLLLLSMVHCARQYLLRLILGHECSDIVHEFSIDGTLTLLFSHYFEVEVRLLIFIFTHVCSGCGGGSTTDRACHIIRTLSALHRLRRPRLDDPLTLNSNELGKSALLQLLEHESSHDLVSFVIVFVIDHDRPILLRVEAIVCEVLAVILLLADKLVQFLLLNSAELVLYFDQLHQVALVVL